MKVVRDGRKHPCRTSCVLSDAWIRELSCSGFKFDSNILVRISFVFLNNYSTLLQRHQREPFLKMFYTINQRCSHGGQRWAGPPSTDNFRPALQLKNRLPPTTKFPPKISKKLKVLLYWSHCKTKMSCFSCFVILNAVCNCFEPEFREIKTSNVFPL